jgi:murein L,D-transpeptidase YcbB/YkuD
MGNKGLFACAAWTCKHACALLAGSVLALSLLLAAAALPAAALAQDTSTSRLSPQAEILRARVEALAVEPRVAGAPVADHWFLTRFYERRDFAPIWTATARLGALLQALEASLQHGLDPQDYHLALLRDKHSLMAASSSEDFLAELEILATDALARLAFHLHFGKVNPELLEPSWNFTRSMGGISPVNAMNRLLEADDLVTAVFSLAPTMPSYTTLVDTLAEHRALAAAGGWPGVPAGPTLRQGDRSPRVAAMRARLLASGDLASDDAADAAGADPELYDAALAAAVRAFQQRHGLAEDAVVGARTLAAMNVAVEARIDQLRVNLERVRWVFRDLGPRYVIANIARYRVTLIEDGEVVWETRAVVGRPYRQTPVFRSDMRYLVFNPTWTVPPGILARDLLPDIRRDPDTLARRNMTLLDLQGRPVDPATVDWQSLPARGFPYMVRQQPGPDNALGQVKFMYPNPHHVYMHDTPARELFGQTDRAFSSGCLRLDNPLELARMLLAETGSWDATAIARVLADGRPRTVNLPRPLPVLTIYATAVAEGDQVLFLTDVYSRDARLLAALDASFRFTPPTGYQDSLVATTMP